MQNIEIPSVNIGGVLVGDCYPTVFMGEIGTFFNKDADLALSYIEQAVSSGIQILKTEILHDPEVCLKNTGLLHEYNHAHGKKVEDYRALIERKIVPLKDYEQLLKHCGRLNVPVVASVYDYAGIDFLAEAGGSGIKVSRDNINNVPLIRYAARTGLPIIIDAGNAYFHEVSRAVYQAQAEGASGVVVNHHPGANPAAPFVHNMRVIQTYKDALHVPAGLSCHYRGDEILYFAVGMGANILEKGVVDDNERTEQDLVSATNLNDLPDVVRKVRNCWQAMGNANPRPTEPRDLSSFKGIISSRMVSKGERLNTDNLRFAWPSLGISVTYWDQVIGEGHAARDILPGEPVRWDDISFGNQTGERVQGPK